MEIEERKGETKSRDAQLPLVEKYRPETLDDVVSQDDIVSTCIRNERIILISENLSEEKQFSSSSLSWTTRDR